MTDLIDLKLKMKTLELEKLKAYSAYQQAAMKFLLAEEEFLKASVVEAKAKAEKLDAELADLVD